MISPFFNLCTCKSAITWMICTCDAFFYFCNVDNTESCDIHMFASVLILSSYICVP